MWKVCPEAGGPVQFPGFNGKCSPYSSFLGMISVIKSNDLFDFLSAGELICPAYHELCSKDSVSVPGKCPNTCNFNGDCVDGKCFCFLGYHGHDCSEREHLYFLFDFILCFDLLAQFT